MHPTYHKRVTFDLAASSALLLSTHEGRSRPSVFLVRQSCALDCDLGSTTTKRLDCDLGSTTTKRGKSTLLHASWTGSGSPQLAKRHVMPPGQVSFSPPTEERNDGTRWHGSARKLRSRDFGYFGGSLDIFRMSGPAGQEGKRFATGTTSRSRWRQKNELLMPRQP